MKRSSIFGQKPWTNPLGKLKLRFFLSKMNFFCFLEYQKTNLCESISPKINHKKFYFLTKTRDYPLRKITICFHFLEIQFSTPNRGLNNLEKSNIAIPNNKFLFQSFKQSKPSSNIFSFYFLHTKSRKKEFHILTQDRGFTTL